MPGPIIALQAAVPALTGSLAGAATTAIPLASGSPKAGDPFSSIFNQAVQQVETFQNNSSESVNRFLSGEGEEIHKVAVASQEADLSFQLFLAVRNKVVAAYQQIMQMQV